VTFVVVASAFIVSMVLSSVYNLVPCELCWYQRVLLFPLPLILGTALLRRDNRVYWYVLPLSITGSIIALYQSLLQWGFIGESSIVCNGLVSCAEEQINLPGFITIPFGAFLIFMTITGLMILQLRYGKKIKADFKHQLELLMRLVAAMLVALLTFVIMKNIIS